LDAGISIAFHIVILPSKMMLEQCCRSLGGNMDEKATAVYRGILFEIKYRIEAIDATLGGLVPLRARIAEELCFFSDRPTYQ
jgi:hypothetical protein